MRIQARLVFALFLLGTLLAACGSADRAGQASLPTVSISSPVNGHQARQGEQVSVLSAATDAQGIARVELWVDGALVNTFANPSPAANTPYSAQQIWVATTPGSHSLMVIAYNAEGVSSNPAVLSITVVAAEATSPPPPSAVPPSPTVEQLPSPTPEVLPSPTVPPSPGPAPTATWTPIAVGPEASPTASSPSPSPTLPTPSPTATYTPTPDGGAGPTRPSAPGPITDFESFGTWKRGDEPNGTFTQSSEQVHGGTYAGKLAYNFGSGGNDYVVFMQSHLLGGQPNQISAWVYGDGSKHYLNVWITDVKGETWQFPLGRVVHTGWQQMSAWLDASAAWPAGHIDGPSNGAIDYPIDFRALVLDDIPDGYTGSGAIYVDDLRCDVASAPAPTPTSTPTATTEAPPPAPPSVAFWADDYTITSGDCTRLRWDVENVREVYLDGGGVVGQGKRKVCPAVTTTYELKVIRLDGAIQLSYITIEVVSP